MSDHASGATQAPPQPEHLRALEAALRLLHATGDALGAIPASAVDLRDAARALERAVRSTLDAFDHRREPLDAAREATREIDAAIPAVRDVEARIEGVEPVVTWLERARGWLLVAEDHYARAPLSGARPEPEPLVVAGAEPRLFRVARPSITPRFDVAEPLPAPPPPPEPLDASLPPGERIALVKARAAAAREAAQERHSARARAREARRRANEEPEAPPAPGFVKGRFAAQSPEAFRLRRARELFDEVAACGIQRAPMLGDAWREVDAIDRRMLKAVDALVSLGGEALGALERIALDTPAKDPSRGFALAFVTGCLDGRDGLAATERVLRLFGPEQPEVARAVGVALKIAPHPEIDRLVRGWLRDDDTRLHPIAVDVLAHRGVIEAADYERAFASEDPTLLAVALRWSALGPLEHRMLARGVVESHRDTRDLSLARAIAWAHVVGGLGAGGDEVVRGLGGPTESALLVPLAIGGGREHALALLERFEQVPSEEAAFALGFAGAAQSLPALVGALDRRDVSPEAKLAVAFALQRITGHEPFEDVDLPPEKLDTPEPADPPNLPDAKPPLAHKVGDPRDRPSDGAPDRMRLPSTRASVWQEYLRREGARFSPDKRHRRGRPFTPQTVLDELDHYAVTPLERRVHHAELVTHTGEHLRFDPHDFVAVQERDLAAWAPVAHRASSQPGAFARGRHG